MRKTLLLFITLILTVAINAQQDTIVGWTFPTGEITDTIADYSNTENALSYITTEGGASDIQMKKGFNSEEFAVQATGWDDGSGSKCWQVKISTTGYDNLKISSKQTAGGNNPGPRDFKLQYKVGAEGSWADVTGALITVELDWAAEELESVSLPAACDNQAVVFLRWIMTSNIDVNGTEDVASNGTAKIDNIFISGSTVTAIGDNDGNVEMNFFPNPCTEFLCVQSANVPFELSIFDMSGRMIKQQEVSSTAFCMDLDGIEKGIYLVKAGELFVKRIVVK